jgi:hypothetical protein
MHPLNPELLFFIKVFIFLTCVIFWVKLAYDAIRKSTRLRSRDEDDSA